MSTAEPTTVEALNALLPQTQCQRCGYEACRPYAEAILVQGEAINRCPPGGAAGIAALAALTGRPALPLDPSCGQEGPLQVARIDEARCIGCLLCIKACPVDAIVGGFKRMHTVIEADCTGCDLCRPACPVDCIDLVDPVMRSPQWQASDALQARARYEARQARTKPQPKLRLDLLARALGDKPQ